SVATAIGVARRTLVRPVPAPNRRRPPNVTGRSFRPFHNSCSGFAVAGSARPCAGEVAVMPLGLLGYKVGMTQVYDDKGQIAPVTVIQVVPCPVLQDRSQQRDGYDA